MEVDGHERVRLFLLHCLLFPFLTIFIADPGGLLHLLTRAGEVG